MKQHWINIHKYVLPGNHWWNHISNDFTLYLKILLLCSVKIMFRQVFNLRNWMFHLSWSCRCSIATKQISILQGGLRFLSVISVYNSLNWVLRHRFMQCAPWDVEKGSILQTKKMHDKNFLFKRKPVSYKIQSKEFLKIAVWWKAWLEFPLYWLKVHEKMHLNDYGNFNIVCLLKRERKPQKTSQKWGISRKSLQKYMTYTKNFVTHPLIFNPDCLCTSHPSY
jgi:hypothetical protein